MDFKGGPWKGKHILSYFDKINDFLNVFIF